MDNFWRIEYLKFLLPLFFLIRMLYERVKRLVNTFTLPYSVIEIIVQKLFWQIAEYKENHSLKLTKKGLFHCQGNLWWWNNGLIWVSFQLAWEKNQFYIFSKKMTKNAIFLCLYLAGVKNNVALLVRASLQCVNLNIHFKNTSNKIMFIRFVKTEILYETWKQTEAAFV